MTRTELEHVIRAAADLASDDDIVIVGSQSILGQFPDAPADLRASVEADVYPRHHPERADLIDGSIGEGSPFHATYGYYAAACGNGARSGGPHPCRGLFEHRVLASIQLSRSTIATSPLFLDA